ncbi:c-type cytochrome domain-containing protein [Mariniblastus fucicola]|uniref:Planctomycete cytochrome C n=1 Tax=Mariniblastus fucicola TaxID=980251 RepID=A0A5B9PDJ3_9BACT|nr:c-type cytochrome domain-containing protein [Mariniblastus fucicola]QEG24384.1 Planctomycete cytochrome C [Mariniblastus fucicola]
MKQANLQQVPVRWLLLILMVAVLSPGIGETMAQELSAKEKKNVEQVKALITKAGLEFKENKFKASARLIANVQKKLARFAKSADGEYRELLEAQHDRMAKAHKMLVDKNQKLDEVVPLPKSKSMSDKAAKEAGEDDANEVSFVSTVAPILNAKCGRCHVARARGQFSARDYNALMDSTTVTEGSPDVSHLIEVIEDGSMPKGGLVVTESELASLKGWIAAGAKFDGDDKTKSIAEMGGGAGQGSAPAGNRRNAMAATSKPTGKETVSFGVHVAPVLLEHCGRCHMARNPRGNFNMAQFRTFIRGGDSGAPVQPGSSANSTLIKRLRGEGGDVMPPAGKLDDAVIDNIAKWIDEGARFDPADANLTMQAVASKGKSESLDHEELIEFRKKEGDRIWKLVMSDIEPQRKDSEAFQLMGTPTEEGLDAIAKEADSLADQIMKQLGTDSRQHFVRGKGNIFVVTRRYDFGEFGKMLLRREFPRKLQAYWNHNGTIAYSAILKSPDKNVDDVRVVLTRQLASMHVADLAPGIPRWFADGMGFRVAAEMHKKDPVVQAWEQDAVAAAKSMNKIDDFLRNRMDEDKSGLVSFLFVGRLKSDRGRFKKLMNGLKAGESFDAVFEKTYGATPEKLFQGYQGG